MTEQQMKGIARLCDFDYSHPRTKILMDTVAAEAREEGIEQAYRAGYEEAAGAPEELDNYLYEWLKEKSEEFEGV